MEDPKSNFFKMPNEFFDALIRTRISGEQNQILNAIIRETKGWNRDEAPISLEKMKSMTRLQDNQILRARKKLIERRMISICKKRNVNAKGKRITAHYKIRSFQDWKPLTKLSGVKNVSDIPYKSVSGKKTKVSVTKLSVVIPETKDSINKDILKDSIKTEKEDEIFPLQHLKIKEQDLKEDLKKERYPNELNHLRIALKDIQSQILNHPDSPHQSNSSKKRKKKI